MSQKLKGVYELLDKKDSNMRYHYGNHPIRQEELERKYGKGNVVLKSVHDTKEKALAVRRGHNKRDRG